MIRPTLFTLLAIILLASCAPATTPAYLYTSQRYAQEVERGVFRLPNTFDESGRDRSKQQRNTVVPVKAGETIVVEKSSTLKGRLLVGLPRNTKNAATFSYNETGQYTVGETVAPEGWIVNVALEEQVVNFTSLVKEDSFYWVDLGGEYEVEGRGVYASTTAVRLSVPVSTQPGRYFVATTFRAEDKKKLPPHIVFIVEVL